MRWAIVGLILVLSIGCVSAPAAKVDELLTSDEKNVGFMLITSHRSWTDPSRTGRPILVLHYRKPGGSAVDLGGATFLKEDEDLILQRLPAGDYSFYYAYIHGAPLHFSPMNFRIVPGQVTYVGDFNLRVKYALLTLHQRELIVQDDRRSALEKLTSRYPIIAKSYPLKSEVTPMSFRER